MIAEPILLKPGSRVRFFGKQLKVQRTGVNYVYFEGGLNADKTSPHWADAELERPPLPEFLGGYSRPDSLFHLNENGNYDPAFVGEDQFDFCGSKVIFNRPPDGLLEDLKLAVQQLEEALANE
jgi:hypothetical protein